MSLTNRVDKSPTVCKVALLFSAAPTPSVSESLGNFFSVEVPEASIPLYTSSGSIKLTETSKQGRAGTQYTQKVQFVLPTTDELRAQRIEQFRKVRYLEIALTNGARFFFGRNDFYQNARPKVSISSNEKLTAVEFTQQSISPLGFLIQSSLLFQDDIVFLFQDGSEFVP